MAKSRSLPVFINKFPGDATTSIHIYVVYGYFSAPVAKLIVVAEAVWPTKLKRFTIQSSKEKFCRLLQKKKKKGGDKRINGSKNDIYPLHTLKYSMILRSASNSFMQHLTNTDVMCFCFVKPCLMLKLKSHP